MKKNGNIHNHLFKSETIPPRRAKTHYPKVKQRVFPTLEEFKAAIARTAEKMRLHRELERAGVKQERLILDEDE